MAGGIVGWMRAHDPENEAMAKAVKLAVVVTVGLAIGTALGNAQMSLFASFGGVALLLFADFPGNRTARLGAYLGLAVVGALLIALGTLMSPVAWLAIAGMAAVGFIVLFCGVLSAAMAGATRAALLTFILPVMVPVPASEIPSRWAGWALAAALAVPAAVYLLPPRDHDRLRRSAAAACAALADQLDAYASSDRAGTLDDRRRASAATVTALRTQFSRTNVRPVSLTAGSRQLMRLTDRLEWLRTVIERLPAEPPTSADHRTVVAGCADALRSAAAVLDQAAHHPSFATRQQLSVRLRALEQLHAGTQNFAALLDAPTPPDATAVTHPATMLELVYTTRLTGLTVATSAAADARPLLDRLLGRDLPGVSGPLLPVHRVLTSHLSLRSVWFQNSVRGALGLTIAVAIAEVTEVSHGFWVVLGAMSVLRTTALNTGSTALRAIGGTVIGFIVGSVVMLLVGTTPWHLWVLLPITVLVAAYLPAAVSFAAGQAAFTLLVVVLFNIIAPTGWQVGLVRVEDVVFGCVSALVSGVLLWPHGAAAAIRNALAEFYRRAADAVVAATDRLVTARAGDPATFDAAVSEAATASLRLDDALREYLFERGTRNVPLDALIALVNGAGRVRMTAEAIAAMTPLADPTSAGSAESAAVVTRSAATNRAGLDELAGRLEHTARELTPAAEPDTTAEAGVIVATRDVLARHPAPDVTRRLLTDGRTLWAAALYLDNITRMQRRLVAPADEFTARRRTPRAGGSTTGSGGDGPAAKPAGEASESRP